MLGLLAGRAARPLAARWSTAGGPTSPRRSPADVVTCHHVVFNVPDLGPFLEALTAHARKRVVIETAAAHPLTSLNPLWLRFHGLKRPDRPTAGDTLAILAAMGRNPGHTEWSRPAEADYRSMAELVEVTRRRLCLPPERAGEVEAALAELGINPGQPSDLGSSGRNVVDLVGGSRGRVAQGWFRDEARIRWCGRRPLPRSGRAAGAAGPGAGCAHRAAPVGAAGHRQPRCLREFSKPARPGREPAGSAAAVRRAARSQRPR
jgi:hypothetical protein